MENYISANSTLGKTDNESISLAIAKAKETGTNKVVIPKHNDRTDRNLWIIEDTIYLPNNIEIFIDDAHLIMADNVFANMFRNENAGTALGQKKEGEQHDITIRGRGAATLDGGNSNGLTERTSGKDGRPSIYNNSLAIFCNVSNLTIKNLNVIRQRWWAFTNIFVDHANYSNIRFRSDFTRIDEDGVCYPNEIPQHYEEVLTKNSDGIDLRIGCHDFVIENITGFIEDDAVALTALGISEKIVGYFVEDKSTDIHDVKIRHVSVEAYCAAVRLLNDEGNKLYNIDINGVHYLRGEYGTTPGVGLAIRIGDNSYAKEHSKLGDTHHVSIRNVITEGRCGVVLCKGLKDSVIENIIVRHKGGTTMHPTVKDFDLPYRGKSGVCVYDGATAELDNCTIRNIVVENSRITGFDTTGLSGNWIFEE